MEWILMLFINGVLATSMEFNTESACIFAGEEVTRNYWGTEYNHYKCVPKGQSPGKEE